MLTEVRKSGPVRLRPPLHRAASPRETSQSPASTVRVPQAPAPTGPFRELRQWKATDCKICRVAAVLGRQTICIPQRA